MRLSTEKNSPHFSERGIRFAQVWVDGVPIKGVVEVDTDEGWADVVATNDRGRIARDTADPEKAGVLRYTGDVRITWIGEAEVAAL